MAWIAERKDVLCGFFWIVTLLCYVGYVKRPTGARYALALFTFCLGLMSKPMIVTLPFVLLLLDIWPLNRLSLRALFGEREFGQTELPKTGLPSSVLLILGEKIPFFALSACLSVVTYIVQRHAGAVMSLGFVPMTARLGNALTAFITYIGKVFSLAPLAVFYPFPPSQSAWRIAVAGLVVVAISVFAFRLAARRPYVVVGWLWYLGTLLPVIGLVQVGEQSHADRYTYIPLVGIFIVLAWGLADVVQHWPGAKRLIVAMVVLACAACPVFAWRQVQYWENSKLLFQHAIDVTAGNYLAHNNLGLALKEEGRIDEAMLHFQEALRIRPQYVEALVNVGEVYLEQGRPEKALAYSTEALRVIPHYPPAHANMGAAFSMLGRSSEAIEQFQEVLQFQPDNALALSGLGSALAMQGRRDEALQHMLQSVRLRPDFADAHYNLGKLLDAMGRTTEAVVQFEAVIRLQPGNAEGHYGLGTSLAMQGEFSSAIQEFEVALRLRPEYAYAHAGLGAALANSGRLDDAIAHFEQALRIDPNLDEVRQDLDRAKALRKGSR